MSFADSSEVRRLVAQFRQLRDQVKSEMASGAYGTPGDRFVTVRELAKRLTVSLMTAQKIVKCLKDEGLLVAESATNPARINALALRPNANSSGQKGSPRRLGLVVTDITNPFFSRLCRHIQHAAADHGYQVLVTSSESDFAREERAIRGFGDIGVEGVLICPGLDDACAVLYGNLIDQGVRLSFVSRRVEGVEADFVVTHNFVGGAAVAGSARRWMLALMTLNVFQTCFHERLTIWIFGLREYRSFPI